MPMTWDEQADARLFAGLLTTHDISVDYKKLADFMGNSCTAKAVTHRVSKIRNLAKNYVPNNDNGNTGTVSTPPATAGRKRSATKATAGEAEASPAKKSKSPVKAAAPKAKAKAAPIEADDDNSDDENGGSNVIKAEE